jgi:hypothetical protein
MKKTLKWLGIIFAALIVIGILFPSEPGDSSGVNNQESTPETTVGFEATTETKKNTETNF